MNQKTKNMAAILTASALYLTAGAASAALEVNVMPSGVTSKVNSWDSGPYASPGSALELWGNVSYVGGNALEYRWNAGCGAAPTAWAAVSNTKNITSSHTYAGLGSCIAVLEVREVGGAGQADSDTVFIDVQPSSFEVDLNLTRQRALKYLYMNKTSTTVNGCAANYWIGYGNRAQSYAALGATAFQDYGHSEWNDKTKDIYAETVENAMNYILAYMTPQGASNAGPTYSDINNNSRMLYASNSHTGYQDGIVPMAIAHSMGQPDQVVRDCAAGAIRGDTYQTVVEDLVDHIAYAQYDHYGRGGWRYSDNSAPDNSAVQWPVLGLIAAEQAPWNINAPAWVASRLKTWIDYSQNGNGACGYTYSSNTLNVAKTGACIIEMEYAGGGGNQANALSYINSNWSSTGNQHYHNFGHHYAMYAIKKGMQAAGLTLVGTHDWQDDYNHWYVNNQINSGTNGSYWNGSYVVSTGVNASIYAALVMAPGLSQLPPVAVAGVDQQVPENTDVNFNGSNSYHADINGTIDLYQWDFDFDGVTFDVDASGVATTKVGGFAITNGTASQTYTIGLRVIDDNVPPLEDTDTLSVEVSNGNVPPVANPGGPYSGIVGEDIVLDGSASSDANEAGGSNPIANAAMGSGFDEIVRYQWDMDGDSLYGNDDVPAEPEGINPTVNFGAFIGTKTIGLKVTDSFGATGAQSSDVTTVAVSDLYPSGYELVSRRYNRRSRLWTITWKVFVTNGGNAAASDVSAILTGANIPAGVTVHDNSLSWTDPDNVIDPAEVQLSGNTNATFSYSYPRTSPGPNITQMTWDIELTDNAGTRHVIRNMPQ